jgi:hypothetical protein
MMVVPLAGGESHSRGVFHHAELSFLCLSQYVGCTLIVSPTLSAEKAAEVMRRIVREGPRHNKRRVSLFITPEQIFVNDTTWAALVPTSRREGPRNGCIHDGFQLLLLHKGVQIHLPISTFF